MKSPGCNRGWKFESKFMRWAKPETAEIVRFANSCHGVMATRARDIKALFDQSTADAEITMRCIHRDGTEQAR